MGGWKADISGACWSVATAASLLVAFPAWCRQAEPDGPQPVSRPAEAVSPGDRPTDADGPAYTVSEFVLRYVHRGHPQHPRRGRLMRLKVTLGETPQGYVAPRDGVPAASIRLEELEEGPPRVFYASAIQSILLALRDDLLQRDLMGVYVAPDPRDLDAAGRDQRPPQRTALRIVITTAIVNDVRTLASGQRVKPEQRVDNPAHDRIRERSPIQPYSEGDESRRDLLRKNRLDNYVFRLSRHPGRRVDVALSASEAPNAVTLDYLITENRPLSVYAQTSNTGTEQTDRLRQRFGLVHNQLTDHDDILAVDFMTSFDAVNALTGSYEAPLPGTDRVRWRATGGWNEYTAREVGVFLDIFEGRSWAAGGDVLWNFYQDRNLFLDFVVGARYQDTKVVNQVVGVTGREDFFLPHVGLRLDQRADWYRTAGTVFLEWSDSRITELDPSELNRLGRLFPDVDFTILRWDLAAEVYLEPLIDHAAWSDPSTPESSTLAHELAFAFRGQYAFDNRLVPQFEQVIGGLYTVRGYPQSVLAGDSVIVGNLEYRFHLPRALGVQPTPGELFGEPFRFVPQSVYGQTDWDLIFRAFVDAGQSFVSKKLPFEVEATLLGAGLGVELQVRRNFNVRVDWGIALRDLAARGVEAGDSEVYVVATLLF